MGNIKDDEAVDELLKGRLNIIQKREGYRFSIDAVLIAGFVRIKKAETVADLGTGCGVIPLILSWKNPETDIFGIELDPGVAEMAKRSVELNGLSGKIKITQGDIRDVRSICPPESFSVVVANPPYGRPGTGRINTVLEKAAARHEVDGSLYDFLRAASYLLKYRGRISVIYPARRLADLIAGMRDCGVEPKRMSLVHSREGDPAKLVMIEGVKGGGVEMEVMSPLYIYDNNGEYTDEVEAMYR